MRKALKFLGWQPGSAAATVEAPRHEVTGALLSQAGAPLASDLPALDSLSFIENEMGHDSASAIAHVLDKNGIF